MSYSDDCRSLLVLTEALVDSTDGLIPIERLGYACPIVKKLFLHALTATQISKGTQWGPDPSGYFQDIGSLFVLARTCVETFLALELLYQAPRDQDEAEFRFCAWMLAGFGQRQGFPVDDIDGSTNAELAEKLVSEKKMLDSFVDRVQKTSYYSALGSTHKDGGARWQEQVTKGRGWHPEFTLTSRFELVFGETFGAPAYRFLCSYSHTTALSAMQIEDLSIDQRVQAMDLAMQMITKSVALANRLYASLSEPASRTYGSHAAMSSNEEFCRKLPAASSDP